MGGEPHQSGFDVNSYTASRRPVALVYAEHYDLITDAISAEGQIKGWRREKKEALIRGEFELLPMLSRRSKK